jgi:hypothetical protein
LRTPVCSYPIIVTHLSFNFLCLLLLYSIYLNAVEPAFRDFLRALLQPSVAVAAAGLEGLFGQ